jgi:hypothetical protein
LLDSLPAVEIAGEVVSAYPSTHVDQVDFVEIRVESGLGGSARISAVKACNSHGESAGDGVLDHSIERNPEVSAPQRN